MPTGVVSYSVGGASWGIMHSEQLGQEVNQTLREITLCLGTVNAIRPLSIAQTFFGHTFGICDAF